MTLPLFSIFTVFIATSRNTIRDVTTAISLPTHMLHKEYEEAKFVFY
jgi:hypothetical protein